MMSQMLVFPSDAGGVYRLVEQARPAPKAGQVLVKVYASSVNRGETQGVLKHKKQYAKPLVVGIEFAGTIEALGDGIRKNVDGMVTGRRRSRHKIVIFTVVKYSMDIFREIRIFM